MGHPEVRTGFPPNVSDAVESTALPAPRVTTAQVQQQVQELQLKVDSALSSKASLGLFVPITAIVDFLASIGVAEVPKCRQCAMGAVALRSREQKLKRSRAS